VVSLTNTHGFWELTLFGQRAAVPHHPALYFVAWLLGNVPAKPVGALELAARVFARFQAHDDLVRSLPWLCRQQGDADVKKVLDQKQRKLENILDHPEAPAAVKAEAQQEIIFSNICASLTSPNCCRRARKPRTEFRICWWICTRDWRRRWTRRRGRGRSSGPLDGICCCAF